MVLMVTKVIVQIPGKNKTRGSSVDSRIHNQSYRETSHWEASTSKEKRNTSSMKIILPLAGAEITLQRLHRGRSRMGIMPIFINKGGLAGKAGLGGKKETRLERIFSYPCPGTKGQGGDRGDHDN